MQQNNVVDFNTCIKTKTIQQKRKLDGRYQCLMSGNRLEGFCEILIYDNIQNNAELFQLQFSSERMTAYWCFDKGEVMLWRYHRTDIQYLQYDQAIILLGDAVRQNYKYQLPEECLRLHASLHVQRIWEKKYYDSVHYRVDWLLKLENPRQFIAVYLKAICNKDGALLYDMTAAAKRCQIARDVYAHSWNHALEEVNIMDFTIIASKELSESKQWIYYVTICGEQADKERLLIDVCLCLVFEEGSMRLQDEHILGAIHKSNCCIER